MNTTLTPQTQEALRAPCGRRFSPSGSTQTPVPEQPPSREQAMLAQMRDNPRVAYRLAHGILPAWMNTVPRPPLPEPARPTPVSPGRYRRPRTPGRLLLAGIVAVDKYAYSVQVQGLPPE